MSDITPDTASLARISSEFLSTFPVDAAREIEKLSAEEAARFLSEQPVAAIVSVWKYLTPVRIDELMPKLTDDQLTEILGMLEPADAAVALLRAKAEFRDACLERLEPGTTREIRSIMTYPVGTVGRVMDVRVNAFRGDTTAAEVLATLRRTKRTNVSQLFIVDEHQHLISVASLQAVAVADHDETLDEIATPPGFVISPLDSRDELAERIKDISLAAVPVVDIHGCLIGAVDLAGMMRAVREESSSDIQTMVGAGKEERALSNPLLATRKRLPWMEINLLTAFLAASVVGMFENTIAQFTALAILLPVVAGQSGNAGAQALAVTMRGLALREITTRHWYKVLIKEMNVGFLNGMAVALTCAIGVLVWSGSWGLSFVIAVSMVLSMIAAGIAGALVPITLTRLGQDPAQSSSIILTTVTDVAGFMSFLGIATLLSGIL